MKKPSSQTRLVTQGSINIDETYDLVIQRVLHGGEAKIRFAYYFYTSEGRKVWANKPLMAGEEEVLKLFGEAIKNNVFTEEALQELRKLLAE